MNDIEKIGVTMDSREIAEITGKNHGDVCRDIRKVLEGLEIDQSRFASVYKAGNGEERTCYLLPPREVMILVTGYSVQLRAAVIDRLNQLEREKAMGTFDIPKDYVSALRLAADQTEKLEAATKQIEADRPKVAFYKAVLGSTDTIDIGEVAKVLAVPGYGRNNLFEALRRFGILMGDNQPYQKYIDAGCFRVVETPSFTADGSAKIFLKTVVFQKGVELCRRVIEKDRAKVGVL